MFVLLYNNLGLLYDNLGWLSPRIKTKFQNKFSPLHVVTFLCRSFAGKAKNKNTFVPGGRKFIFFNQSN